MRILCECGPEGQGCKFPPCKSTLSLYSRSLPGIQNDPVPHKEPGAEYKVNLDRECQSCGVSQLRDHLRPALDDEGIRCCPANWWRWENAPINATSTRMQTLKKESSFDGLVEALEEDLDLFSCHLFSASW